MIVAEHIEHAERMRFVTAWLRITGRQMPWPFRVCGTEQHPITARVSPLGWHLSCKCGAGAFVKRQNALARAAKVRAWVRNHVGKPE